MTAQFKIGAVIESPIDLNGIKRGVRQRYVNYAERLFGEFVARSPVYTGSFRASWRVSVNGIDESITKGGSPEAPLPAPVFPGIPKHFKLGDTVVISNSQPYALRLENGWSKQAPAGIVKVTLAFVKP